MASKRISELSAISALDDDDVLVVIEDGNTRKVTIAELRASLFAFRGVRAVETTPQAITTGATGEAITFSAETFDTDAFHSVGANTERLTIPAGLAGYYHITGQLRWDNQTAGTYRRVRIYLSSGTVLAESLMEPESSGWSGHNISADYYLAEGDYVRMIADHDRGSDLNVQADNSPSVLSMYRTGI